MIESTKWPTNTLAFFLFLTGAAALVMPRGYSLGFYGISLLGLMLWPSIRNKLIEKDSLPFAVPLLAYTAAHLMLGLHESFAWRSLDPLLPFCVMVFGLWALRQYKPSASWFWGGLALGAIGGAVISGYQVLKLGVRADGFTHAIQFGNIALLFGVLCMTRALVTFRFSLFNLLMWLGFASGLLASAWSQTRGGWIAIVLVLGWVLSHTLKTLSLSRRWLALLVLVVFITVPVKYFDVQKLVETRVLLAVEESNSYVQTGQQNTSVGARLAMWRFAINKVQDAPWLGHGPKGWVEHRDKGIADGRLDPFVKDFSHVHNEFLDMALKRGLIGVFFLMLLYLGPIFWFFKPFLKSKNIEMRSLAIAGMVIPMMYIDFGFTQLFLGHNSGRMVLVSLWMCVAALLLNAKEKQMEQYPI